MKSESSSAKHTTVIGVNHQTASVELRDRLLFSEDSSREFASELCGSNISEMVILSTCNRSEIYAMTHEPEAARLHIEEAWAKKTGISSKELQRHTYFYAHGNAIRHLLRVCSSLDSMVVGESQVFGQVKDAFFAARENGFVDFFFNRIFESAIRVGKRVRSETAISQGAVSISYAAVELARKVLGQFEDKTAGIIGSGEMGELAAANLNKFGVGKFIFFNRSMGGAKRMSERFGGDVCLLEDMRSRLHECDIVISATGAAEQVVTRDMVSDALKKRQRHNLFLIDIAAPRDIEESVGDLYNTFLFTIDDLKQVVEENKEKRQEEADLALAIIDEEVVGLENWMRSLDVIPVISELKSMSEELLEKELSRARDSMSPEEYQRIEELCRNIIGRLLHPPIAGLKELGESGQGERAVYYARKLFGLDEPSDES